MGRVVVSQFVSVDGVMEDPGGSEGWDRGGWVFQFDQGEEGSKFKLDEVMGAGALLLGRTTYAGFAEAWPSREGDFADKFNTMPKYVVSTTLSDPGWNNSTVIGDDLEGRIGALSEEVEGDILVNGSAQLVHALAVANLVDEYRLMVFPLVLGGGKRLFGDSPAPATFALESSRPVGPDGVVILTYRAKS